MPDLTEVKKVVKNIIQTCPFGEIQLLELDKQFRQLEGVSLRIISGNFGFDGIASMLKTWPELKVVGSGLTTKVRCLETNHITEMNRYSKNSGKQIRLQGYQSSDSCNLRPFDGKDQFAFSSEGDYDHECFNSEPSCDDQKLQRLEATAKPVGPLLIKDILTVVPAPVALDTVLDFSQSFIVALMDSANPHRFWFATYGDYKKLNELTEAMNAFYSVNDKLKVDKLHIQEGLYVAALFNSLWHRAKIIAVSGEIARLFYIDYGTVEDVTVEDRVRFLREDFANLPAVAHRGVLSHVQPTGGAWSEKSIDFFMNKLKSQKLEVKIFKKNVKDSSYFMAIKAVIEKGKDKKLVSSALIEKEFCIYDVDFLGKSNVNDTERDFCEYEAGKFLKDQKNLEKNVGKITEESWLPSPTLSKAVAQQIEDEPTEDVSNLKIPSSKPSSKGSVLKSDNNSVSFKKKLRLNYSSPSSVSTSNAPEAATVKECRIAEQRLVVLKVGAVVKVYVHVVNDVDQLFFYLKSEFIELRSFLKSFNDFYTSIDAPSNLNVTVGSHVVTFADENFCRGQITEQLDDGESCKVFLVDFGIVVERNKAQLFKLFEEFATRQGAVYSGQLANIPEHVHIKTRDQVLDYVSGKFVRVQITRIDGKRVEMLLIDQ